MLRRILGLVYDGQDKPIQGAKLVFKLSSSSFTDQAQYLGTEVEYKTGINGAIDLSLWCNTQGLLDTYWTCLYEGSPLFAFKLPPGADIQISELRKQSLLPAAQPANSNSAEILALQTQLNSLISEVASLRAQLSNTQVATVGTGNLRIQNQTWVDQNNNQVYVTIERQPDGKDYFKLTKIV